MGFVRIVRHGDGDDGVRRLVEMVVASVVQ